MKYPWDRESRACYCKREVRAELALFRGSEKSVFSSQLCAQDTSAVPKGRKQMLVQCRCEQTLFLQSSCALLVL